MSKKYYIVRTDDDCGEILLWNCRHEGANRFSGSGAVCSDDNDPLLNNLQLAQDVIDCIPEGQHIASTVTICSDGIVIPLVEDEPTKGWKWLQAQPIGTQRENCSEAKFTIKEDGLHWRTPKDSDIWYWDGTRKYTYTKMDWRTHAWVVNASEETCPEWEEPVKLTGWEYLYSLPNGSQYISLEMGLLVTKLEDGIHYRIETNIPKQSVATWDGRVNGRPCSDVSTGDWRDAYIIKILSEDTIEIQEPPKQ